MTRYSVQPRDRIFLKGYGFLSFAKNMGRVKQYSQKLIDHAKQSATDALKLLQKKRFKK